MGAVLNEIDLVRSKLVVDHKYLVWTTGAFFVFRVITAAAHSGICGAFVLLLVSGNQLQVQSASCKGLRKIKELL